MHRILFAILLFIPLTLNAADNVLMRLQGSNTIGAELAPELVRHWLGKQGYSHIKLVVVADESVEIQAVNRAGDLKIVEVQSHGSGTGFSAMAAGKADIAMSSRPIKPDEQELLSDLGDMSSYKSEKIIGLDGIAVIVNQKNPVSALSKETLSKIFSGEVRDWSQISAGMRGAINIYARDNKSGTYDTFKSLVLGKNALMANAARYESSTQLSDDVAQDVQAIGFIGLPYVRHSKALAISEKGTAAKLPEIFDVATEDYALSRRLYLYVPATNDNPNVDSFMRFVAANEGQQLVQDNGFVAQKIMARSVSLDQSLPEEYLLFTKDSERLSMNIRFNKGMVAIDTKAHHDISRLVEYMEQPDNKHKKIMLFGFSDETRAVPEYGEDLAIHRVDRVADLLVKNGLDPVRVRGYGSTNPVAANDDSIGRFKNRRVEVWVQ